MGSSFNISSINNLFIGGFMSIMHFAILFLTIVIILVTDNLFILYSIGIIELIILFVNYKFGDCPVSVIEEHYMKTSFVDLVNNFTPVNYSKDKKLLRPEITLQWIFMLLVLVLFKILIVFMKMIFSNIKITDNIKIILK
jgi:hypothetical protein